MLLKKGKKELTPSTQVISLTRRWTWRRRNSCRPWGLAWTASQFGQTGKNSLRRWVSRPPLRLLFSPLPPSPCLVHLDILSLPPPGLARLLSPAIPTSCILMLSPLSPLRPRLDSLFPLTPANPVLSHLEPLPLLPRI